MEIVAIVSDPAGASAHSFAGRPLTQHMLFTARATRPVSRTILATHNATLARLAADADADVVETPTLSAPSDRALLLTHVLGELRQRGGPVPAIAVLLDPRHAFCSAEVIEGAIDHLLRCGADTLFSVTPVEHLFRVEDERGGARRMAEVGEPIHLAENGAVVVVRVGIFTRTPELPVGRTVLYRVPALAAMQFNDGLEQQAAEGLYEASSIAHAKARFRHVEMLVFDFDGVMTDNRVLVFEDGREAVLCNRSDGLGLERLRATGLSLAVISKEVNPVVAARCRKLKIPCEQGVDDKLAVLEKMAAERGVALSKVAFVGNDINDLACLTAVGVAVAPADAYPEVLRVADVITARMGGFGAVREVCDLILAVRTAA